MKQRFSSLDVKVIAHELSSALVSLRVSNIYDLSSRIFLFKFAKPEQREQLIIDSGHGRCSLALYRSSAKVPSYPTSHVCRPDRYRSHHRHSILRRPIPPVPRVLRRRKHRPYRQRTQHHRPPQKCRRRRRARALPHRPPVQSFAASKLRRHPTFDQGKSSCWSGEGN